MNKNILLKLSTFLATVGIVIGSYTYGTAYAESPKLSNEELYNIALERWVDKVIEKESNGRLDVVIIDTNGKHSRGCLQFQDGTWNSYTKKYGISGSPLNCDTAKKVAIAMIKDNHNLWRSWYTTVIKKGVGLPPKPEQFL